MKVIEEGKPEQGEPIEPKGTQPTGKDATRQQEREQYRYGGIPIGSDPRE